MLAGAALSLLAGTAVTLDAQKDQSEVPLGERSLRLPAASTVSPTVSGTVDGVVGTEVEFSESVEVTLDLRSRAITATQSCPPIRLMPLGDSLTSYPDSYRGPLYRSLREAGWNVDFVGTGTAEPIGGGDPDHEGHGGYRIGPDAEQDYEGNAANLADRIEGWLAELAGPQPEVIVLNVGTNDIGAGGDTARNAPTKLVALIGELRRLIPGVQIVVGGLPPNGWSDAGRGLVRDDAGTLVSGTPEMAAISAAAADAARAQPTAVQVVPVFARLIEVGFDPTPGFGTSDNTHFSVAGGEQFAAALLPETTEALLRVRRC
jgi:lysophospholipase L1-like esterase